MSDNNHKQSRPSERSRFATTHWSVVRAAARPGSSHYQQALETLCRTYWFALYAYLRRKGYKADEADDLTQGFFARILEKDGLRLADPTRGKFRSFLLAALNHFIANEADRAKAKKRGGGLKLISLDLQDAEKQYALKPADRLTPEKVYDRYWAMTVLEQTMTRLEAEAGTAAAKQRVFERLKIYLTADKSSVPYRRVAEELGMSEGAVKVAVHRLKRHYRQLLRDQIAQTVAGEDEIDAEIRELFAALTP